MTALQSTTTTTVTGRLQSLHSFLEETNDRLKAGQVAGAKVWPSGFGALDKALTGGFRSGELVLLGGPQGLGKTTFGLQVMRNLIAANHSAVYFSFEHDNHTLLERLIAMEAAEIAGPTAVPLHRVRQAFEARHGSNRRWRRDSSAPRVGSRRSVRFSPMPGGCTCTVPTDPIPTSTPCDR